MNFLFYDLEFASCKGGKHKVCEFGYTITNEHFEIQEEGNYIINPRIDDKEWDLYALENILTRTKEEYKRGKVFSYYYEKIKEFFKNADYVFGHTNSGDAQALNDELLRYELPPIDHDFYDIKEFYKIYSNTTNATSLENIVKHFGIDGDGNNHDAQSDAYNTMVSLKMMLEKMNLTLEELIKKCPSVFDKSENYQIWSIEEAKKLREEREKREREGDGTNDILPKSLNRKRVSQFISVVKRKEEIVNEAILNKVILLSELYERHHYKQTLNLIQIVKNNGGRITNLTDDATLFVDYNLVEEGQELESGRKRHLNTNTKIIDLPSFLESLKLTEEELDAMPLISFDFLDDESLKEKRHGHKRREKKIDNSPMEEPEKLTLTLEDLFNKKD